MAAIVVSVETPHATAYDEDYPTRSTENYSHALHEILQDQEDDGWIITDHVLDFSGMSTVIGSIHDMIEDVFDYAAAAITGYRSSGDPGLTKPTKTSLTQPGLRSYYRFAEITVKTYAECMKMLYLIYYMWETEEDPLLLKEKLQQLLIAWPLLDTTIELSSELGQQFKVYPSWKNADLDL
jgi:hypothetical protein